MTFLSVIEFGIVSFTNRTKNKICLEKKQSTLLSNHVDINLETIQEEKENKLQPKLEAFCVIQLKSSMIDKYSRIVFPSVFGMFHLVYWIYYLTNSFTEKEIF